MKGAFLHGEFEKEEKAYMKVLEGWEYFLSFQCTHTPVTYNLRVETSSYGVLEETTYECEGHGFKKKHC